MGKTEGPPGLTHLREHDYACIQYGEDATGGIALFDMRHDRKQYTNLADSTEHKPIVDLFRAAMTDKLQAVRKNDLHADGVD